MTMQLLKVLLSVFLMLTLVSYQGDSFAVSSSFALISLVLAIKLRQTNGGPLA